MESPASINKRLGLGLLLVLAIGLLSAAVYFTSVFWLALPIPLLALGAYGCMFMDISKIDEADEDQEK